MPTEHKQRTGNCEAGTGHLGVGTDAIIRKYATIAAAMEILPDALASVGILPLQLRLIYLVGKEYGCEMDSRHVLELAATFGIGIVAQTAEATVRKFMGVSGPLAIAAAASATFGITYALGKVADHYYRHGRNLAFNSLKGDFDEYRNQAKGVYEMCKGEAVRLGKSGNPAAVAGEYIGVKDS